MPEPARERSADSGDYTRGSSSSASAAGAALDGRAGSSGDSRSTSTSASVSGTELRPRAQRYLAAPSDGDARRLRTEIDRHQDIALLRLIEPAGAAFPPVAVLECTPQDAAVLAERTGAMIEPDQRLRYGAPAGYVVDDPAGLSPVPDSEYAAVTVEVRDDAGRPIADAAVHLIDHASPARAVTGRDGRAELRAPEEAFETATAILVLPPRGHWSTQLARPALSAATPNVVTCRRLEAGRPEGPRRAMPPWSWHALGLDRLAPGTRGAGARIALIDSGADLDHPLLAERVAAGYDFVDRDEKSWRTDLIGSGTCAASVLADTETGPQEDLGTAGICPEAEIHMLKVMPGGHTGDLIEALDYCIAHGIDVASVAVGEQGPSFLLASKIQQARAAGMCIIAAAGDDGGSVAYPAAFPDVVSVGALGSAAAFPAESHHASRVTERPGPEGYFTAYDAEARALINLYAPAVAVLGAAPGGGLTARDGTALAAAHAAGIAALIAVSHPALRTSGGVRGVTKADLTGRLLIDGSRLVQVSASGRLVRVPDASAALGLGLSGGVTSTTTAMSMPTPTFGPAQVYAIR